MVVTQNRWSEHWRELEHNPVALREARLRRGWSQRRLASEVDVSMSHISYLEAGKRNSSQALLLRLAKALRCSASSLEHRAGRAA